jgi:hypothetical protein
MANVTNKIFVDTMGGRTATQYIGKQGEIFYDPAVGDLRLSDGQSVGGKSLVGEQFAGVYRGYQAGVNFFRNTNDQDIAQVIIHNAEGRVDYINYTTSTNNDDFYATNLLQSDQDDGDNRADKIVVLNLYGATKSNKTSILSISDVRNFVRKFIDLVLFDDEDTARGTLEEVKTAFYANSTALAQSLPDGSLFEQFAFDDYKRVHWPEYNIPEGVDLYADVKFWINNLDDTSSYAYDDTTQVMMLSAGSGFSIGDTIVMSGGQMGGVDEVNDLTLTVTGLKNGGVTQLQMTSGGNAFRPHMVPGDYEQLSGGAGGGCGIHITSCTEAGTIINWELRNGGGTGYEVGDTLTLNYGGADATFEVISVGTDGIDGWNISGTVYRDSPGKLANSNGYWPKMHIGDGRDDQYDSGNYISTNLSVNIVNANLVDFKMYINNTIKSGVTLMPGMLCTVKDNDYNTFVFRLVSQSTDEPNVWYIDENNNRSNVEVRIDGIPYGNGDVVGSGAFGETSEVTLYDNSIFAMVAFNTYVDSVYYNGEMGADERGYKEVSTLLGAHTVDYAVKSIPQTLTSNSNYYLKPSDAGKHIYYNDGGDNTVWLTAASSENFPVGTAITIVSGDDGWTFIRSDDNNVNIWGAGFNTTSNYFYIPANSMATLLKIGRDKWMVSGAGLGNDD